MARRFRSANQNYLLWLIGWSITTRVLPASTADVSLAISSFPTEVLAGNPFTLTLLVSNQGPDMATSLLLTNPIPGSVIVNSVTATNGTAAVSNKTVKWIFAALPYQATAALQITLTPVSVQTVTNRCGVIAAETDPVAANNLDRVTMVSVNPVEPSGNLTVPRWRHSATVLNDGKVLLTGGWTNSSAQIARTPDVFATQLQVFSSGGSPQVTRYDHTATLLPDGKVLIAGGNTGGVVTAAIELYDPGNGLFTLTNSLNVARAGHTATRLLDGRVVIAGGITQTTVEVFNYTNGAVSNGGNLLMARSGHIAALLPSGRILFAGGASDPASAEEYDPQTRTSTAVGNMITNHTSLACAELLSGKVLVFGGNAGELYDPDAKAFLPIPPPLNARTDARLTVLNDGRVLICGGITPLGISASTEFYDPVTNGFSAGPPMTRPRFQHSAVRLQDGRVLIAGGFDGSALLNSELLATMVDSDHDGMDDDWELKHDLDPTNANDAGQDADGDGMTNLQEFLAGTDPRDPDSVLKITSVQANAGACTVTFTTAAAKRYILERTTNFVTWEAVSNNIQGTGANAQVMDSVAAPKAVYRVKLMR